MKKKYKFKFSCKHCGQCCKDSGFVYFTSNDIKRASKYLKIAEKEFCDTYLIPTIKGFLVQVTDKKPCIFLSELNRCIINKAKPEQCLTFPYWDNYSNDKGELVNFNRTCPGVIVTK